MEQALLNLVQVARETMKLGDLMDQLGYGDSPYWNYFGQIADAIYYLLHEDTKEFTESVTYEVLYNPKLSERKCVKRLLEEYKKNRPAQS